MSDWGKYCEDGRWYRSWETERDEVPHAMLADVDTGEGDWTGGGAALARTQDGKYWAAHNPGGCSCVTGPSSSDWEGPYETLEDALRYFPDDIRALIESDLK